MVKDRLLTPSFLCILAANFLMYFGFWLLIPILPFYLQETFGLGEAQIGSILCLYTLSALGVRPFMGYLYDGFDRKPLYLLAYVLFVCMFAGYLIGGSLALFILLRVLHGIAFGTVTVGGNTLVIDITPSSRRGEALGYYGLTNNTAMSIGPMTGLFLHDSLSFQSIFFCGLASCLIGLCCASCVRAPRKAPQKRPPLSLDRFILLKGLPASLALLLLSIPYGATTNYVAMYAQQIGLDVPTGFFFTLMAIGMGVSRLFSGRWVDKGYITQVISGGFYIIIAAFIGLSACAVLLPWSYSLCTTLFYCVPLMLGVGFGIMFPAYNTLYVNLAPNSQRGTATGTYLTAWDVGIGLGIVSGGLIARYANFSMVYFVGGVLCILSAIYFSRYVTPHFERHRLR